MIKAYQACRVCGVHVPSGFTNCDGCYHRMEKAKVEEISYLQAVSNPGKLKLMLLSKTGQRK